MTIDVNAASAEDWTQSRGWPDMSRKIVCYRGERGGFSDLRQLDEVPGLTGKISNAVRVALSL